MLLITCPILKNPETDEKNDQKYVFRSLETPIRSKI